MSWFFDAGRPISGRLREALRYLACASLAIATQHAAPDVALAGARIGIVLLHGALATPGELDDMAKALTDTGYVVEAPEMCWSRERHYDKTFLECLAEIGPAVAAVKAKGAAAVVVAGFAFGGSAAIAYGARHGGLAGIAALAPDHEPDRLVGEAHIAKSLALVIRLNEAGKGNQPMDLAVYVNGKVTAVRMTARFYPTFFAVNSPGSMPANTPKLTAPLLWVAGVKDKSQLGPAYAFAKAPANPLNRYVKLASDHAGTLAGGKDTLLSWLSDLAAALH